MRVARVDHQARWRELPVLLRVARAAEAGGSPWSTRFMSGAAVAIGVLAGDVITNERRTAVVICRLHPRRGHLALLTLLCCGASAALLALAALTPMLAIALIVPVSVGVVLAAACDPHRVRLADVRAGQSWANGQPGQWKRVGGVFSASPGAAAGLGARVLRRIGSEGTNVYGWPRPTAIPLYKHLGADPVLGVTRDDQAFWIWTPGEPPDTWDRMQTNRPTRTDDTTIIVAGRRATVEEMQRYVEADLARRPTDDDPEDGSRGEGVR